MIAGEVIGNTMIEIKKSALQKYAMTGDADIDMMCVIWLLNHLFKIVFSDSSSYVMEDKSFSSDDSDEEILRLSTSFNSHPSRAESSSPTHSWSTSSSSSPLSSPGLMQAEGDAEQLENLIGIKQKKSCEVCGKKVINMNSHNVRMHGEGTPGFAVPCGQCDRIVVLSALGKHVLEYHMDTEKSRSISPPPPLSDEELTEDEKLVPRKRSCQYPSTHSKKIKPGSKIRVVNNCQNLKILSL